MAAKVMLEVTQSLVSGNEVAVHSGALFDPDETGLPEGVTVRPVLVDVPDKPAPGEKPAAEEKPAAQEPAKKTGAR